MSDKTQKILQFTKVDYTFRNPQIENLLILSAELLHIPAHPKAYGTVRPVLTLRQHTQETWGPSRPRLRGTLDTAPLKHILGLTRISYTQFLLIELPKCIADKTLQVRAITTPALPGLYSYFKLAEFPPPMATTSRGGLTMDS